MKDIKNFLNLRKVATNFMSRRDYENTKRLQFSPTAKELEAEQILGKLKGSKLEKTLVSSMQHNNPFDIIGNEMALDLLKVHESIDISRYKSIDNKHIKRQRDYNHNEIDKIFTEMVEAERRVELNQKKQMQHKYRHIQQQLSSGKKAV